MNKKHIGSTWVDGKSYNIYDLEIDPSDANTLLAQMPKNRTVHQPQVQEIARDITNGDWHFGLDLLLFDEAGRILPEGQHRLRGVIESGQPTRFLAIYGHPHEVMRVVGAGRKRTFGQRLQQEDIPYANETATLVLRMWHWDHGNYMSVKGAGAISPSDVEQKIYLEEHREEIEGIITGTSKHLRSNVMVPMSVYHQAAMVLRRTDAEDAEAFLHGWSSGAGLDDGSAILALREQLMRRAGQDRPAQSLARVIKAWNSWRHGVPTTKIQLPNPLTNRNFPQPQ